MLLLTTTFTWNVEWNSSPLNGNKVFIVPHFQTSLPAHSWCFSFNNAKNYQTLFSCHIDAAGCKIQSVSVVWLQNASKWLQPGALFFSRGDTKIRWIHAELEGDSRDEVKSCWWSKNTQRYRVETPITNNKLLCCCSLVRQMTLRACLLLLQWEQTAIEANALRSICPGSVTISSVTNYRTTRTARGFLLSPMKTPVFQGGDIYVKTNRSN